MSNILMRLPTSLVLLLISLLSPSWAQVKADFTANQTSGCGVVQVNFINQSTGPITGYQWTLGANAKSSLPNPSKIYIQPGKYQVCLTVKDSSGNQDTHCKDDYIQLYPVYKADFEVIDTLLCVGQIGAFLDRTISPNGRIVSWAWDLGGSTGFTQLDGGLQDTVFSQYNNDGKYKITLNTKDEVGCLSTVTKSIFRVVEKPVFALDVGAGIQCDTLGSISIKNLSPNLPEITYDWDFGNGQTFSGYTPPPISYTRKGQYSIKIIANNKANECTDSKVYEDVITVLHLSSFTVPIEHCQGNLFKPMNTSELKVDSHFWNFGDGTTFTTDQPTHSYSTPGCYTITHRVTYSGCASQSQTNGCVNVRGLPTSNFTLDKTKGCDFPVRISPINLSNGGIGWNWTANGHLLSREQNPVLEIKEEGRYRIGLEVINAFGCSRFVEKDTVVAYRIKPIISSDPVHKCAPVQTPFEHKSTSVDPITNVRWILFTPTPRFINGNQGNLFIADTGQFTVRLIVQNSFGCTDSLDFPSWISTGATPVTGFSVPQSMCFGLPLEGKDASTSFANEFIWSLDNSEQLQMTKDARFKYDDLKTYTISHQAFHNGCPGALIKKEVKVIGVKAEFEPKIDCKLPFQRTFVNESEGLDSVSWDFGITNEVSDTSLERSPIFSYKARGEYPVKMIAYNFATGCVDTSKMVIPIKELKADFEFSTVSRCLPLDITIHNKTIDGDTYIFNFPGSDQKISEDSTPTFHFSEGNKTVGSLIAIDIFGCRDTLISDTINLHQAMAIIIPARKLFCQDSVLTFLDQSLVQNDIISKTTWIYDNQVISDRKSVDIRLGSSRNPEIKLRIETAGGCISENSLSIQPNHIKVTVEVDSTSCIKDSVKFHAAISGQFTSVKWDFGDGESSTIAEVNHRYKKDGNYTSTLKIIDDSSGCALTYVHPSSIKIGTTKADFDFIGEMNNCRPFYSVFINKSQFADKYIWDLGDQSVLSIEKNPSHIYPIRGYYDISLIAYSTDLCRDTLHIDSLIFVDAPMVHITSDTSKLRCTPTAVSFSATLFNANKVLVEYGDGGQEFLSNVDGEYIFKHTYEQSGIYYPVIVVTDSSTCAEYALDTLTIHTANAQLKFRDTLLCGVKEQIRISDSSAFSSPILTKFLSLKGIGVDTTFRGVPDSFQLTQAGKYTVEYRIASEFCADTILYNEKIILSPQPEANFTLNLSNFCAGDSLIAINTSQATNISIDSIFWSLGKVKTFKDTFRTVLTEGLSTIQLIAKTPIGCTDTAVQMFNVKSAVFSTIPKDTTLCNGSLLELKASLINPVPNTITRWRTGRDTLCVGCTDYSLTALTSARYIFETVHPSGCIQPSSVHVNVKVDRIGNIRLTNDTILCKGEVLPLSVETINDVFAYQWDPTKRGLSCYTNCKNPIARPDTTTTYVVRVSDGTGCERLDSVTVTLRPNEIIDLGPDRTVCKGETFSLHVQNISRPSWSGSSGLSCTNCADPILRPIGTSTYILNAFKNNCPVKDSINIFELSSDLITGSDTSLCVGNSVVLRSNISSRISWSPALFLNDPLSPTPTATPTRSITYVLSVNEDLCTTQDSIRIKVLQNTEITGQDKTVCPNEDLTLSVQGIATSYEWTGPNILGGQKTSAIVIKPKISSNYQVIARNNTCNPDTQAIKVTVIDFISLKDSITFNAIADLPVKLNRGLNTRKQFMYSWSPPTNLSCTNCVDPIFVGAKNSQYSFELLDPASGCSLTQLVKVNIVETCQASDFFTVPNVFSPNQDGVNDLLFVIPKAADQLNSFRIFDRLGDLVFESHDVSSGWDGRFRNNVAPNGVYVYIVEAECPQTGARIFLKGDITLIR